MILKNKSFFIGVLLLSACNSISYDPDDFPKNPFFDLKSYFETEMLRTFKKEIKKTTTIDGEKETVTLEDINLEEELRLFAEANLNKVSWYEKYAIDTVAQSSGGTKIIYKAKSPELKTQEVNIYTTKNNVDSITIYNHLHSIIMDTDQYLKYDARTGYQVKINQKSNLQDVKEYNISVEY